MSEVTNDQIFGLIAIFGAAVGLSAVMLRHVGGLRSPRAYKQLIEDVVLPADHWQRRRRRWAKAQAKLDAMTGAK